MAPRHLAVSPSINFTFLGDPAAEGNFANITLRPELPSRRELLLFPRDLNKVSCRILRWETVEYGTLYTMLSFRTSASLDNDEMIKSTWW